MKQRDQKKVAKYKPFKRLIHLSPKEIWSWKIHSGHLVFIKTADHKTIYTRTKYEILGIDEYFDYDYDDDFSLRITPNDIREEILKIKANS